MEQSFMSVFFGAIIGAVISFLTMVAFVFWKKQSVNKSQVSKESIMYSIGELCAEIDSLIAFNKEGIINNSGIQNSLRKKHDEIIRLLKPNMHILDVYFVKYVDYVQKDYLKLLSGTPVDTIQSPVSSKSIAFTIESKAEVNKSIESNLDKSGNSSSRTGSVEHDLHALESAFFKDPGKLATGTKKSVDPIFFEPNEPVKDTIEKALDEKEFVLVSDKKPEEKLDTPVVENVSSSDAVDEEEFTMETIMDLDIGKLARASGLGDNPLRALKKHDPFKPTSKDPVSNPLKTFLTTKKAETSFELPVDKIKETFQPTIKNTPEIATPKLPSKPIATAEKKSTVPVIDHSRAMHDDKKDIEITGDDVASKIDAFFGIDKDS